MVEKIAARKGIEITPPQKRGATTRAIGLTAIMSIALSCSVVFMRPISAVTAEPNNKPATTGPSSRVSDKATSTPSASPDPKRCRVS